MTTATLTLTEFLLARIAEDYERERGPFQTGTMIETAARVRANLRRIAVSAWSVRDGRIVPACRVEAAKYADRPGYRPEWRP